MKKILKYFTILAVCIIVVYFSTILNIKTNPEQEYNPPKNNEINTSKYEKAYVNRIVDGDTIEVEINGEKYKVRFIGVNCPENTSKVEYYGKESTKYTTEVLKDKYIYLEKDISNTDKYDRLLRYVWLEIPKDNSEIETKSKMFNALLAINGYAEVATYPPDVKHSLLFKDLVSEARNNNVGLWKK